MSNAVKVAISLPTTIFESVESERQKRQESRSEFFRQAVVNFLRGLEEKRAVARYVEGYLEQPETEEETQGINALANTTLAREPW